MHSNHSFSGYSFVRCLGKICMHNQPFTNFPEVWTSHWQVQVITLLTFKLLSVFHTWLRSNSFRAYWLISWENLALASSFFIGCTRADPKKTTPLAEALEAVLGRIHSNDRPRVGACLHLFPLKFQLMQFFAVLLSFCQCKKPFMIKIPDASPTPG